MERWKPKRCYKCKSEELRETTAEDRIEVAGLTFTASIPAIKCAKCGEETYAGPDLEAFEVAVAGELARHGVISAEAFAFMRRAIGMQARDLAELLDVAPETISRWEHVGKEMTTQQAANLLNVSRQYLVRLLNEQHIPFTKTGKHRRLRIEDVLKYKAKRDQERRAKLEELIRLSEETEDNYSELRI